MIRNNVRFLEQLKRHEGYRSEAYRCTAGALTIGYGHNCDAVPVEWVEEVGDMISRRRAEELLKADVEAVIWELDKRIPWWRGMKEARQGVVLNMAYNMGVPKLMKFRKMLAALKGGDWNKAALEMGNSLWAVQVKGRARELMTQMVLGEWQEA